MKLATLLLFAFLSLNAYSQKFAVKECSNAAFPGGLKISIGDKLNADEIVVIKKKGKLTLDFGGWPFSLYTGTHHLDSVLDEERKKDIGFKLHDSIYTVLAKAKLSDCDKIGIHCGNPYELLNPNYKKPNRVISTNADSVLLKWDDRPGFTGKYYPVVSSIFEDLIHLEVTNNLELSLNLLPFKKNGAILYKVISDDCTASDKFTIKMR